MLLVRIARLTHTVLDLDPAALLNHVSRLVGGGVQVRRLAKGDVVAGRERFGTQRVGGLDCTSSDVRARAAHVVASERTLDRLGMWQRLRSPRHAGRGDLSSVAVRRDGAAVARADHLPLISDAVAVALPGIPIRSACQHRRGQPRGQRALAGRDSPALDRLAATGAPHTRPSFLRHDPLCRPERAPVVSAPADCEVGAPSRSERVALPSGPSCMGPRSGRAKPPAGAWSPMVTLIARPRCPAPRRPDDGHDRLRADLARAFARTATLRPGAGLVAAAAW